MTRAAKLAVTVWGVTALSGCAATRLHDKPNSSGDLQTIALSQPPDRKTLEAETTASYLAARDSLRKALEDEALAIMETPIDYEPVAKSRGAFTKKQFDSFKIKNVSPDDTAHFTPNYGAYRMGMPQNLLFRIPFIDCDEILDYAADADHIRYMNVDGGVSYVAVKDLQDMRDTYARKTHPASPVQTKLYISFEPSINAERFDKVSRQIAGLPSNVAYSMIHTGYLKYRDMGMARSTLRHERGHDVTEPIEIGMMSAYDKKHPRDSIQTNEPLVRQIRRYNEYLADSLDFADENENNALMDTPPLKMGCIRRFCVDYQMEKAKIANFVTIASKSGNAPDQDDLFLYDAVKSRMAEMTGLDDDADTYDDHPSNARRIYYYLIHQRRAREFAEHGNTILYRQYGDLLPKPPIDGQPLPKRSWDYSD